MRYTTLSLLPALLCTVSMIVFAPSSFAATFTVMTTADSGVGSLRDAILASNANPGVDTIGFQVGAGGPQIIALGSALPNLTDAVVIDGTSQPGFAGTPIITLDGPGIGFGNGLTIVSSGPTTVRGVVIVDFGQAGIEVQSNGATIIGNYLGIDASGAASQGNFEGIHVAAVADDTVIGGPAAGDRNVISGNRSSGIRLSGDGGVGASDNNVVQGNIIGLDASGVFAVANEGVGVWIDGGDDNRIGGRLPGEGNVISGNGQTGIFILPSFSEIGTDHAIGNIVQGNLVGTDVTGMFAIPNRVLGVGLFGAKGTVIGGADAGERNIIAGNGRNGVTVGASSFSDTMTRVLAENTVIAGNFIGTDGSGTQDLGNGQNGVVVAGARATTIGGTTAASGNLISGNSHSGVLLVNALSSSGEEIFPIDTVITSNLIGTDVTGTMPIANTGDGVAVVGAQNTIIGRPGAERNLISGNEGNGITLAHGLLTTVSTGHVVRGNLIGTAIDGSSALPNGGNGVRLESEDPLGLQGNVIGGVGTGDGNTIWFNGRGVQAAGGHAIDFSAIRSI